MLFTKMAAKVSVASREYALNLYRQLLSLSKRLPSGQQRDDAVRSVRQGFRTNAEVTDPSKASLDKRALASVLQRLAVGGEFAPDFCCN